MILLVGAGPMAQDYAKVLMAQNVDFKVVGRGQKSAKIFGEVTGKEVVCGGLENYFRTTQDSISSAIVAVSVEQLANTTIQLLKNGVHKILVEKPAGLDLEEIQEVKNACEQSPVTPTIIVAYNRRCFSSVETAKKIIDADGGAQSIVFEITEWAHVIEGIPKADGVKENWFLANTSHVADLAFYLAGQPSTLQSFTSGKLDWHGRSSNFAGAGITVKGALFSYHGNWTSPGRWSVEVLTNKHRLILRPIEKLQIQKIGSINLEMVEIDEQIDTDFKPGLYQQVEQFLAGSFENLCSLSEHYENCIYFCRMAGYTPT